MGLNIVDTDVFFIQRLHMGFIFATFFTF